MPTCAQKKRLDGHVYEADNAVAYIIDWSDSLYQHGITGGNLSLHVDPNSAQFLLLITYQTRKPLSEKQKAELLDYSRSTINSGLGTGLYWHLIDSFEMWVDFRGDEAVFEANQRMDSNG